MKSCRIVYLSELKLKLFYNRIIFSLIYLIINEEQKDSSTIGNYSLISKSM